MAFLRIWILASAFASATGWTLSVLKSLNATGYGLALLVGLGGCWLLRGPMFQGWRRPARGRLFARFHRPLPGLFLLLTLLVFLGGVLYPPTNYDALTYRVPRALCWLQEGHWSWLHTPNVRMNDRSCGSEWLTAPLLLFSHSIRGLFLVNFFSFLLLPGLIFSVYTRLGIHPRVAAVWMWLVPTGYGFLLQAGSIGNDALGAVYALAAVDFALRAAKSRSVFEAALSMIAMAVLGGTKSGNLPLMLPWLIVFVPAAPVLLRRPALSLAALALCGTVSFLPMALLNQLHCGDWTGFVLEPMLAGHHPWAGLLGNSLMVVIGNFVPPLFPFASRWNSAALGWLPAGLSQLLSSSFEPGFHSLGEIPTEESSGLGFGLSVLLLVSWMAALRWRRAVSARCSPWQQRLFLSGAMVALLFFFAKSAMSALPRLILAYYPLLIPALLAAPAQAVLVRKLWWRRLAIGLTLLAVPSIILTPARPLWPTGYCLRRLSPDSPRGLLRAKEVYATYGGRSNILAPLSDFVPKDCTVIGFLGAANDSGLSLWYPLGSKRVDYLLQGDSLEEITARGIHLVVVSGRALTLQQDSIEQWLLRHNGELIGFRKITSLVREGPVPWYVVRLHAAPWSGSPKPSAAAQAPTEKLQHLEGNGLFFPPA